MQTSLSYRTNRDLFSNYYLDEHLPETEAWDEVGEEELREAREDIVELWEREKETAPQRNESQLEEKFVRPVFRRLGIPFEVEESTSRTQRRPDYGFFESEDAARGAFDRREAGGDFYENAVAVADAKRWGRSLDTRGSGEHERDFENPSYQIHVYLQETPVRWAVLTDGKRWRLYYGPTSHRLDSYYEVDLPTVLEQGDLEDFKYFYLFFRHGAFVEDASGDCFLDDVYDESNVFAQELGEDLQENIYEAIKVLAEGFLQYPDNELDEETLSEDKGLLDDYTDFEQARLDLIHDSALIYLYRLIFVLYAESEGRELLETDNEIYEQEFSLNSLKQDVADEVDSADSTYRDWQNNFWERIAELFELIDQGSEARNIPEDELHVPAYDGGLFRTDPDEDDKPEALFLADYEVGDTYLAEVIDLVTRSRNGSDGGKIFVDYSSLDVRHLGSIYEGLLEYELNVADEPLTLDDGEYASAGEDDEVVVEEDEVYLSTDSGERKATGSYYTPEYVVEYIVENTLGPLVEEIREDLVGRTAWRKSDEGAGTFAEEFAQRVFDLKILDPAMGSGHFLTSAVDYLAREIIDAQERQAAQQGIETVNEDHDINWARRQVAQRCIYGVDLNPLAVELAKVSLWLRTLAAEQPLAFLDHHLKTGNSLVGSDIEEVLDNGEPNSEDGQLTLRQSFDRTRQEALEHATEQFQSLLAIDNETLADVKEMEEVHEQAREDPVYQQLVAMANVDTAECFGLDVPDDAYERMAEALRDDSWDEIEGQDWFETAQAMAEEEHFFHWELQFPVVFYEDDGRRKVDAGFDAVMGNPPYVPTEQLPRVLREYLTTEFEEVLHRKYDSSVAFLQQSFRLCRDGAGHVGMITPVVWETGENYERFRRHNFVAGNVGLRTVVNLPFDVFEDAYVDTTIAIFSPDTDIAEFSAREFDKRERITDSDEIGTNHATIPTDYLSNDPGCKIYLEREYYELIRRFDGDQFGRLGDYTDACQGIVASFYEYADEAESNDYLPYRECDVYRYECTTTAERYIDFSDEDTLQKYYTRPRVLVRRLVNRDDRLMAAYVEDEFVTKKDLNPFISDTDTYSLKYILASLNSTLHSYLYVKSSALATKDDFRQTTLSELRSLPVRTIPFDTERQVRERQKERFVNEYRGWLTDENERPSLPETPGALHDSACALADSISELKMERSKYKDSLLDHLGNYLDGPTLPDVGLFQPTSDATSLDATTDEYENLRIGDVTTERDGDSVTINATARYKTDDEDDHETDQWGYTETDHFEAFMLANLSETEAALVEAFVPAAVDEADGFAGFRENATKTNSLVDRLKAITLPDPDDVADDLRRYVEARNRAEELDGKIEKTDRLIDEIVYDLYGLSEEEIEVVESAIEDG